MYVHLLFRLFDFSVSKLLIQYLLVYYSIFHLYDGRYYSWYASYYSKYHNNYWDWYYEKVFFKELIWNCIVLLILWFLIYWNIFYLRSGGNRIKLWSWSAFEVEKNWDNKSKNSAENTSKDIKVIFNIFHKNCNSSKWAKNTCPYCYSLEKYFRY